jgi:hypothetical protein
MIYPATYNIVVLQGSTWKAKLRLTSTAKIVEIFVATGLFSCACHGLSTEDAVIFTAAIDGAIPPCGLEFNKPYYVISAGLTDSAFAVSETLNGSAITLHGTPVGTFKFAVPIDITGAVIDADIKPLGGGSTIKSFNCSITSPTLGELQMLLSAADTAALDPRSYGYDLSITTAAGEKYYWLSGKAEIKRTYSRA